MSNTLSAPAATATNYRHWRASHLLMVASGFAGLGYQIVWTQQCALWLGHEAAAVLAVVAAFFGGIALGALLLGKRIESSHKPLYWYAGAELLIALWSMMLALAMSPFSNWLLELTGVQPTPVRQWATAFGGTLLLLLPATAAMGATLPAMERLVAQISANKQSLASLYAANTFGAVLGVLAIAFWLVPAVGLQRTAGVCVLLNLLCCIGAVILLPHATHRARPAVGDDAGARRLALLRLAVTGFLGIGYEVLVVRVLSQVAEDTIYTFAIMLAVYLVGSAIGAALFQRRLALRRDAEQLGKQLLSALAVACVIGAASLWFADDVRSAALHIFGSSMSAALAAEAMLAVVAFGFPTLCMGALFSHLVARAIGNGSSFGRALGINTMGAALAPLVFGVVLFPAVGPKLALLLIPLGYLALAGWRAWKAPSVWVSGGAALAIALWAPRLAFIDIPADGRLVSYQEGIMAAVSVVEDADGVARLRIDNRQQEGSSATLRVDARQALLPLYLHAQPRRALFLGLGTGVTASAAATERGVQVDAVELLPEVIASSRYFTENLLDHEAKTRLHLIGADARRFVRTSAQRYDVIVSDNFHPARSGSGSLYTVEHFQAVRARLSEHGIFCQWLPLHQLDLETLRSIVQAFLRAYPDATALIASNSLETPVLGLIGRSDHNRFEPAALRRHLAAENSQGRLVQIGIEDEFALLGSFIAGPAALRNFAGAAPANTDDTPIVAYRAPRIAYAPDSLPRERLIALLQALAVAPADVVANTGDVNFSKRLSAYWQARNRFIESGRDVRPASSMRDMLAQVQQPLLAALRISPDFRPAYDPLLLMAKGLARTDVDGARALLQQLASIQPARTEAVAALARIEAANL